MPFFPNVPEALAPLSAGTEYQICAIDCNGNAVTLPTPHPTWTNGYGKEIIELDMVLLGGQNGLNN
jgi:hypothetical protein